MAHQISPMCVPAGSSSSRAQLARLQYTLFQRLCVAAFIVRRPHAPQLIATVQLMGTSLPRFKGEATDNLYRLL
ncbi:hypothetical protein V8E52_010424 [Russula decolorans]